VKSPRLLLFILNWQDKIRLYEKQVSTGEQFLDALKCVMLQKMPFAPLEELHAIKTQADQRKTQSGMDLTYKKCPSPGVCCHKL
jgi:hypothetical protein